jgi:hypothetical protein
MLAILKGNRRAIAGAGALLVGAILLAVLSHSGRRVTLSLDPANFRPEQGDCYMVAGFLFPFSATWDSPSDDSGSTSILLEDGKPLGPAHSLHDDIRAQGGGRFSFWSGTIYISASDNSDPRRNGRVYSIEYPPAWPVLPLTFLALIEVTLLTLFFDPPEHWSRRGPGAGAASTQAKDPDLLHWLCVASLTAVFAAIVIYDLLGSPALIFGRDSYSYLFPAMQSLSSPLLPLLIRDLGYVVFLAGQLRITTLASLPWTQAAIVVAGVAAGCYCLSRALETLEAPRWVKAVACAFGGILFIAVIGLNDGYMGFIFFIGPEAIHPAILLLALAAVVSFPTDRPRSSAAVLIALAILISVATIVRPHSVILTIFATLFFLTLCFLPPAGTPRSVALTGLIAFIAVNGTLTTVNMHLQDKFSKTMAERSFFCNRQDMMRAVLATSQLPERRLIADEIAKITDPGEKYVRAAEAGPCMYGNAIMDQEIAMAATAEGVSELTWLRMILIKAIAAHPIVFMKNVMRQYKLYFTEPLGPMEFSGEPPLDLTDWKRLTMEFPQMAPTSQDFQLWAGSRIVDGHNNPLKYIKYLIFTYRPLLTAIGWIGMLCAVIEWLLWRSQNKIIPLIIYTNIFLVANTMTVAISNTFEVWRYVLAVIPLYAIWVSASFTYILISLYFFIVPTSRPQRLTAQL